MDEKRCPSACYAALRKKRLMRVVVVVVVEDRGRFAAVQAELSSFMFLPLATFQ